MLVFFHVGFPNDSKLLTFDSFNNYFPSSLEGELEVVERLGD